MRFSRKSRVGAMVPTASMADIAFLLLVFFMVSTVFVRFRGIPVTLPDGTTATFGEKIAPKLAQVGITDPVGTGMTALDKFGQGAQLASQVNKLPYTMMYGQQFAADPALQEIQQQDQQPGLFGNITPARTTWTVEDQRSGQVHTFAQAVTAKNYAAQLEEAKVFEHKGGKKKCIAGCEKTTWTVEDQHTGRVHTFAQAAPAKNHAAQLREAKVFEHKGNKKKCIAGCKPRRQPSLQYIGSNTLEQRLNNRGARNAVDLT